MPSPKKVAKPKKGKAAASPSKKAKAATSSSKAAAKQQPVAVAVPAAPAPSASSRENPSGEEPEEEVVPADPRYTPRGHPVEVPEEPKAEAAAEAAEAPADEGDPTFGWVDSHRPWMSVDDGVAWDWIGGHHDDTHLDHQLKEHHAKAHARRKLRHKKGKIAKELMWHRRQSLIKENAAEDPDHPHHNKVRRMTTLSTKYHSDGTLKVREKKDHLKEYQEQLKREAEKAAKNKNPHLHPTHANGHSHHGNDHGHHGHHGHAHTPGQAKGDLLGSRHHAAARASVSSESSGINALLEGTNLDGSTHVTRVLREKWGRSVIQARRFRVTAMRQPCNTHGTVE